MPLAFPAVTRAVLAECRFQLGQTFHGGLRTAMIVFAQRLAGWLTLAILERHRNQLFLQPAVFIRGVRRLLRAQRELILRLPRDALLLPVKFRGVGHVETAIGVEQRDHERVFQLCRREQE